MRKNFNARRTLHAAIDTVRAINKLREGSGHMDGARSGEPEREAASNNNSSSDATPDATSGAGAGPMLAAIARKAAQHDSGVETYPPRDAEGDVRMDLSPEPARAGAALLTRKSGQGQSGAEITAQEERIREASRGLWQGR